MESFEAIKNIDNFCKVLVKDPTPVVNEISSEENDLSKVAPLEMKLFPSYNNRLSGNNFQSGNEEPLVDVFDEGDNLRVLVQCRCREQQVTFHPAKDGVIVCREECFRRRGESETCRQVCRKLPLDVSELQLEDMCFIIAKCNNNNTLEAMIPKAKRL